jgi:hypothetical protein
MLVLSVVLQLVFPRAMGPLPTGLRTPVLALEIARSPQELETMFGPAGSPEREHWVAQVDRGGAIDFAFIAIYGAFLIACMRAFVAARPPRMRIGIALALLACVADAIENASLFSITARLGGDYAGALSALTIATWVKWLSIATCLLLLSSALRQRGKCGAAAGWLSTAALPVTIGADMLRGVIAEIMLLVITLSFIAIWIEALRSLRRGTLANQAS